jgi:hypothetical protein
VARLVDDVWRDPRTELTLRAWEVDPHNLDFVRREVSGLLPGKCSMTLGYRSDTRASAKVEIEGAGPGDGSWVRLTLEAPGLPTEELGTLCVKSSRRDRASGITTLDLQSAIWAISEDRLSWEWTVGAGTRTSVAIDRACAWCARPYVLLPGFRDGQYGSTVGFERSDAFSTFLFDACSRAGDRMDVDGHGRLSFAPYTAPEAREPDWDVDERDPRSVVLSSGRVDEDASGEAYGRTVVVHNIGSGDGQVAVTGEYDVPDTHAASFARRGFNRTKVREVQDMSPETGAEASRLAERYSATDADLGVTRTATVMWCPVTAGDVIRWTDADGETARLLVKTAECSFERWDKELTMEVLS